MWYKSVSKIFENIVLLDYLCYFYIKEIKALNIKRSPLLCFAICYKKYIQNQKGNSWRILLHVASPLAKYVPHPGRSTKRSVQKSDRSNTTFQMQQSP